MAWTDCKTINGFPYTMLFYYQFSSGTTTAVILGPQGTVPGDVSCCFPVSTDGIVIVWGMTPVGSPTPGGLNYFNTASPSDGYLGAPGNIRAGQVSTSRETIGFGDLNGLIRYYDFSRRVLGAPEVAPSGSISANSGPAIWGDRIAYYANETQLGVDCDHNGMLDGYCLQYWNLHPRSFEKSLLDPNAAPPVGSNRAVAIYDKIIAYSGNDGKVHWVTVPMEGDVDLDGKVDIVDVATAAFCFGRNIAGNKC